MNKIITIPKTLRGEFLLPIYRDLSLWSVYSCPISESNSDQPFCRITQESVFNAYTRHLCKHHDVYIYWEC